MQSKRLKIQERRFTGLRINSVELQTERQGQQQLWGEGWTLTGGRAGLPLRWKARVSVEKTQGEFSGEGVHAGDFIDHHDVAV